MKSKKFEQFFARIVIENGQETYLYNREAFGLLNIGRDGYDESQFIEVGDTLNIDTKKYKVTLSGFLCRHSSIPAQRCKGNKNNP